MDGIERHPRPTTEDVLRTVDELLREGAADRALKLLGPAVLADPFLENARGVCLLRLGRFEEATALYQRLVLDGDSIALRDDRPTAFVTNFALALLLGGNPRGCLVTLHDLDREDDDGVRRIRACVERWRAGLGAWRRMLFGLYGTVDRAILVDWAAGELVFPSPVTPPRAA